MACCWEQKRSGKTYHVGEQASLIKQGKTWIKLAERDVDEKLTINIETNIRKASAKTSMLLTFNMDDRMWQVKVGVSF